MTEENVRELLIREFAVVPSPFVMADIEDIENAHQVELMMRIFEETPCFSNEELVENHEREDAFQTPQSDALSIDWYLNLSLFTPDVLHYIIPRLMVNLLDGCPGETGMLVNFISDPSRLSMNQKLSLEDSMLPGATTFFEERALDDFSLFNPNQIEAVTEWLQLARTWDELEYRIETVDSAINFWQQGLKKQALDKIAR